MAVPVGFFKGGRGLRQGDTVSLLLYVRAMGVFCKIVTLMPCHSRSQVQISSNLQGIKIELSCLFRWSHALCKAEAKSTQCLKKAFRQFSNSSGLHSNDFRSYICIGGLSAHKKANIRATSDFIEGTLPFRYVGVPNSPSRLSSTDCQVLVDRLTCKIRVWQSRNFFGEPSFRDFNKLLVFYFHFTQSAIKQVEQVCRNFLWSSSDLARHPLVAWESVWQPKAEGGLWIKNIKMRKKVLTVKHIWAICMKKEILWVIWVHQPLKGKSIWDYQLGTTNCWYWEHVQNQRWIPVNLLWQGV